MTTARDPNDYFPQDDLDAPATSAPRAGVAGYVPPEKMFAEGCPKCRGTGKFVSYSGRVLGNCFACKGKGSNTFKTSPDARAKSQGRAAAKRVDKAQQIEIDAQAWQVANPAEFKWLTDASLRNFQRNGTFTFPADLLAKLRQYGSLTSGQIAAVQRLMAKDVERNAAREVERAEREANAPVVNTSKIEEAFATAAAKAARPGQTGVYIRPLLLKSGDVSVAVTPGSAGSKWEGMLFVKTRQDGKKLGYIKDGKFTARFECTDAEKAAVLDCAENPAIAAVAFGKAWSVCGVCARKLHNDVSIARGIGPICAERFGW
jgi:uncharacterized Zn finger protein (UPF0148 family)